MQTPVPGSTNVNTNSSGKKLMKKAKYTIDFFIRNVTEHMELVLHWMSTHITFLSIPSLKQVFPIQI